MFTLVSTKKEEYVDFLQNRIPQVLPKLKSDRTPDWGKMTAQHMIEHMQMSVTASTIVSLNPPKAPNALQLEGKEFIVLSPNDMPRGLQNPVFQFGLPAYTNPTIEEAKEKLIKSIPMFFRTFQSKPTAVSYTPYFGDLTYDELLMFHYKHFKHHFTQFGLL